MVAVKVKVKVTVTVKVKVQGQPASERKRYIFLDSNFGISSDLAQHLIEYFIICHQPTSHLALASPRHLNLCRMPVPLCLSSGQDCVRNSISCGEDTIRTQQQVNTVNSATVMLVTLLHYPTLHYPTLPYPTLLYPTLLPQPNPTQPKINLPYPIDTLLFPTPTYPNPATGALSYTGITLRPLLKSSL